MMKFKNVEINGKTVAILQGGAFCPVNTNGNKSKTPAMRDFVAMYPQCEIVKVENLYFIAKKTGA